ncbi:MAG TPA: type II CAAX endopeptidase family protein [Phycisphaerae bacterium]|jgi:hypothetical protein
MGKQPYRLPVLGAHATISAMPLHAHVAASAVDRLLLAETTSQHVRRSWSSRIDLGLLIVGGLVILVALVRWIGRGRPNPLRKSPERPNRMPPDAILFPFLIYAILALVIMGIGRWLGAAENDKHVNLLANNISQIAGAFVCLVVARRWFAGGARTFVLGLNPSPARRLLAWTVLMWAAALPLAEAMLRAVESSVHRVQPDYVLPQHIVVETLMTGGEPAWFIMTLWLGAVVIAPIAEEFFFRGLLQTSLVDLARQGLFRERPVAARWMAVAAAGVAFGLSHMAQWHAVPALAVFGIMLGVAYERTGSLVPPILMHALFNLTTLIGLSLG